MITSRLIFDKNMDQVSSLATMRTLLLSNDNPSSRAAIFLSIKLEDHEANMDALEDTIATSASFQL